MTTYSRCGSPLPAVTSRSVSFSSLWGRLAEAFWFALALALFMVLGPFAAPVALMAVFGLDPCHCGDAEPESVE